MVIMVRFIFIHRRILFEKKTELMIFHYLAKPSFFANCLMTFCYRCFEKSIFYPFICDNPFMSPSTTNNSRLSSLSNIAFIRFRRPDFADFTLGKNNSSTNSWNNQTLLLDKSIYMKN